MTRLFWDQHQATKQNVFHLLCWIVLMTGCFTNLLHFPYLNNKLQLPELFFIALLPFVPYKQVWKYHLHNNRMLCSLVVVYLIFDLTSSVLSRQLHAVTESIGRGYLFVVFLFMAYHFSLFSKDELIRRVKIVLLTATFIIALMAVIGYGLVYFNRILFVMPFHNYPYFGTVYRFTGPTIHPTMLICIVAFLFFLLAGMQNNHLKKATTAALLLLLCCAVLSFSKSVLLLFSGAVILFLQSKKLLGKGLFAFITVATTLVMILITHLLFTPVTTSQKQSLDGTSFTSGRVLYETQHTQVLEAGYLALKRVELDMARNHLWFGIGTGNFNKALHNYKQRGLFPKHLPDFDPHSTYLGALVENGLLALVMLLLVFFYIFRSFGKKKGLYTDPLLLSLFVLYLNFLVEGIATDILNFRHLWLFIALAVVVLQKTEPKAAA